jgi:hypothetical protein
VLGMMSCACALTGGICSFDIQYKLTSDQQHALKTLDQPCLAHAATAVWIDFATAFLWMWQGPPSTAPPLVEKYRDVMMLSWRRFTKQELVRLSVNSLGCHVSSNRLETAIRTSLTRLKRFEQLSIASNCT